jgi:hypothetical protein
MSRNFHFCWLLCLLILFPGFIAAQKPLNFGKTSLEKKKLDIKKVNCYVTPEIVFDTNNRKSLTVILNVDWQDKNNIQIKSSENYLYLIDDFDKWMKWIKESDNSPDSKETAPDNKIKSQKPIMISENTDIRSRVSEKGYIEIAAISEPILLNIDGSEKNNLSITFYFTYVTKEKADKVVLEEANKSLTWNFSIPSKLLPPNECELKQKAYSAKISDIINNYTSLDFLNLLKQPQTQLSVIENKFIEFKKLIEAAKNLDNEIAQDASLIVCPGTREKLKGDLNSKIPVETDMAKIAKEIEDLKPKATAEKEVVKTEPEVKKTEPEIVKKEPEAEVKRNLKAEADTIRKKYEGIYSDLSVEFNTLAAAINVSQANIENRLNSNSIRLSSVQRMFEKKDKLSADSLNQMSNDLKFSKNENQDNDSSNHALLNLIRNFKDKIEREKSYCTSEFLRLDKKTVPAEGLKIQAKLDELFVQASKIESGLDKFRVEIYRQNTAISELITKIEGNEELLVTKELFNNSFNTLLGRLENLKSKYNELDQDFNNKKFSKWYFKRSKEKFLSGINEIKNSHLAVKNSFDSLVLKKNDSFKKFDFDPLIDSQQEFEKAEAGFNSRLETLRTNINDWEYMPFPYFKVVIAFMITALLVFGFIVYFMALKKRKLKAIPLRSSNKNPAKNVIKLQQTEINKAERGKGLFDHLRESGNKYLELDLSVEWEDSCVKKVYFERDCIIRTYRFFEDSIHIAGTDTTANETGGYLIGQWDFNKEDPNKYDISIEDFIEPGDDASFSRYQLNFGAKIGVKLQTVLDNYRQKTNRDLVLTAWFHSHPGLKIFLSDYDLTVQEDFAGNVNKHKMIALVLDPYTPLWDMGIFTYKSNGEMNNAADSIRFFSFDSIYHWALNPQPQYQLDNYFSYNLSGVFSDPMIKKIFFSNPCILEIKRFVEDARLRLDSEGIFAYLVGDKILHQASITNIIIDNIARNHKTDSDAALKENKIVGTIVCLSSQDKEQKGNLRNRLAEMKALEETMPLLLVFNPDDDSFLIVPKMKYGEINAFNQESMAKILLSELIEWTRKRK